MDGERKLAIYAVEQPVAGADESSGYFHSFLVLVDETDGPLHKKSGDVGSAEQELHFFDSLDNCLKAHVYTRKRDYREKVLTPYLNGDESYVRSIWNRALKTAAIISRLGLGFTAAAYHAGEYNCRSGTKAALEAMGFNFISGSDPEMQKGTQAQIFAKVKSYLPPINDAMPLEDLRQESAALACTLA